MTSLTYVCIYAWQWLESKVSICLSVLVFGTASYIPSVILIDASPRILFVWTILNPYLLASLPGPFPSHSSSIVVLIPPRNSKNLIEWESVCSWLEAMSRPTSSNQKRTLERDSVRRKAASHQIAYAYLILPTHTLRDQHHTNLSPNDPPHRTNTTTTTTNTNSFQPLQKKANQNKTLTPYSSPPTASPPQHTPTSPPSWQQTAPQWASVSPHAAPNHQ